MIYRKWKSPVGALHMVASDAGLHALAFDANWERVRESLGADLKTGEHPVLALAVSELEEYFSGKRHSFSVPLALAGTEFQRAVWKALDTIAYGSTATYGAQASLMKKPRAVRAVGRANGLNPVCILVPCHRVVGADGSLTGYAGGLAAKKALLELEGKAG